MILLVAVLLATGLLFLRRPALGGLVTSRARLFWAGVAFALAPAVVALLSAAETIALSGHKVVLIAAAIWDR